MSDKIYTPALAFRKDKDRLVVGTYNGRMSFTIFGENGKTYGGNFQVADIATILETIERIEKAPGGSQLTLTETRYVDGGFKPVGAVSIGRTDDGIYYIEIHHENNGNKLVSKFDLVPQACLKPSDKEFNMSDSTKAGINALKWFLNNVIPAAMARSVLPPQKRGGGNNTY